MLVKEGHKKSYIIFGILQLLLAIGCIGLMLPYMLKDCGITIQNWVEFADKVKNLSFGKYIFAGFNFVPLVLFIITAISLMFRRSGASLFVKIATIVAIFPTACSGLEYGIYALTEKTINLTNIFKSFMLIFFIASVVLFVIGLIFQFSVSKTSPNKSNVFQIVKALFWIVILAFNFVFANLLEKSVWINGLLGYQNNSLPYFLCWMFLILGILELCCSTKIIEAKDSKVGVSTSYQTSQTVTTDYVPESQEGEMAATPTTNITINQTFQGVPQGLEDEANATKTPGTSEIGENLASSEATNAQQENQQKTQVADYNEDSGLLAHKNMEERTESYLEKLEKITEKLESEEQAAQQNQQETNLEQNKPEPVIIPRIEPTIKPKPITLVEPATPLKETTPAQPTTQPKPIAPAQPTTPVQPTVPTQPTTPTQPANPTQPTTPIRPATQPRPTTQVQPTVPIKPTQPQTPAGSVPTQPQVAGQSASPSAPQVQSAPVQPTVQSQPTAPATPAKKPVEKPKKVVSTTESDGTTN